MEYEVGSRYPKKGDNVKIVQKKDYHSGKLTSGTVLQVFTKDKFHPRGHKVKLTNGLVGRVQEFIGQAETNKNQTINDQAPPYSIGDNDLV